MNFREVHVVADSCTECSRGLTNPLPPLGTGVSKKFGPGAQLISPGAEQLIFADRGSTIAKILSPCDTTPRAFIAVVKTKINKLAVLLNGVHWFLHTICIKLIQVKYLIGSIGHVLRKIPS